MIHKCFRTLYVTLSLACLAGCFTVGASAATLTGNLLAVPPLTPIFAMSAGILVVLIATVCVGRIVFRKYNTKEDAPAFDSTADSIVPVENTPESEPKKENGVDSPAGISELTETSSPVEKLEKTTLRSFADAVCGLLAEGSGEDMNTTLLTPQGHHIVLKCRLSFRARMIMADAETKIQYSDLKNYILSHQGVEAADSQNYESYTAARRQLAKINLTGKTLVLYLALDPATLQDSKYKYDNVGDRKRFEKTPVKIKIRSARSFKWALELVDMVMATIPCEKISLQCTDYVDPPADKASLIARGLVQVTAQEVESGKKIDENTVLQLIQDGAVLDRPSAS